MSTQSKTIAAGEFYDAPSGNGFFLIEASAAVKVEIRKNSRIIDGDESAEAGWSVYPISQDSGLAFDRVRITNENATSVTVKFWTTEGAGRYSRAQPPVL